VGEPQRDEEEVPADDAIIGRAFRWSLGVIALLGAAGAGVWYFTRPAPKSEPVRAITTHTPEKLAPPTAGVPAVRFTDVTAAAGIQWRHFTGARGDKLLPESMGGGSAFFDYDGDGDPDLLFVGGDAWPGDPPAPQPSLALYRNDSGRFTDVTSAAGLAVHFYGMGAAAADFDGDGDPDLLVTGVGGNHLFENRNGVFADVTAAAGVGGDPGAWTTGAAWFDADGDGDLDLFVCSYVQWSRDIDFRVNFTWDGTHRAYGPPNQFAGSWSTLYRNDGGRFTDVSAEAGIRVDNPATHQPLGKALAVLPFDLDHDGRMDLLVANDTVQKFLFHNEGGGKFREIGAPSGFAFNLNGAATGAMGIDAGWFRNDATLGIGIGNFANEMTSFFVSQEGPLSFADQSIGVGVGSPSRKYLKFGLIFLDYDLDGRQDLMEANGHLEDRIADLQSGQTYAQPAQVFWNTGGTPAFVEVPAADLGDLPRPIVGRGASYADVDGDGDLDVLMTQVGGAPVLLRNDQALGHHWLRVRVAGAGMNREAIGATVTVVAGGVSQKRVVMPFRSYLSQVELPVTFGLGAAARVERVDVEWPDGKRQSLADVAADKVLVVSPP
jgi:hypothetical protein